MRWAMPLEIVREACYGLYHHWFRAALSMLGISWGIISVVVLLAYGNGFRSALDAGFRISVEDRDEPLGLWKRKRPEQDGIDHREDGEVRPETDRDRGERGQGERRRLAQLAKGVAKVVHGTLDF